MTEETYSAEEQRVLELRAKRLAEIQDSNDRGHKEATVAVVSVGNEQFGMPVERLREIISTPPIAALPQMPAWLPGIVQVRGELISVLSLAHWFGIPNGGRLGGALAVIDCDEGAIGLLVDAVLGFRELHAAEIAERHETTTNGRPIRMTTRDLIGVLDMERLLADERIIVGGSNHASAVPNPAGLTSGGSKRTHE